MYVEIFFLKILFIHREELIKTMAKKQMHMSAVQCSAMQIIHGLYTTIYTLPILLYGSNSIRIVVYILYNILYIYDILI